MTKESDIICYISTPIAAQDLSLLLESMSGFVVDVDDAENIILKRVAK